jgi:hypothetical protein
MIVIESAIATRAKPSVIWNRWIDVPSWKDWILRLSRAQLNGGFKVGSRGELHMGLQNAAVFTITRVEPDKQFELRSQALTSWIFGLWFRFVLKKELPASLTRLAFLVEEDQDRAERELHSAQFK